VGISIQSIIAALLILEESLLHLLKLRETIQETMSQSNSGWAFYVPPKKWHNVDITIVAWY
jgi:high-affinity nickel permease